MYLGIDIGTSRTKAAIVTKTSRLIASDSVPTPPKLFEPGANFLKFIYECLTGLILRLRSKVGTPEAISISSVAPALVAFYENHAPQLIFSHLTPTTVHYAQGGTLQSRLDFRRRRTEERLATATSSLAGRPQFFLPLASAVALMISGEIVLDPINAYELGFASTGELRDFCRLTGSSQEYRSIRERHNNKINFEGPIAVTTDSCASMIGAGLRRPSDGMIYYGTYHSALELNVPILDCLLTRELNEVPYFWHVSIPQYGRFLESFLIATTCESSVDAAFTKFQEALNSKLSVLVISNTVKVRPKLPEIITSDTPLAVQIDNLSIPVSFVDLAFAIASPLGDAIRAKLHSGDLNHVREWFAAGGGAHSHEILMLTSQLTGLSQAVRTGPGTAKGAAMVAAFVHQNAGDLIDNSEVKIIAPFSN